MGGDEWSFLDEEVARLERKGGKGGNGGGGAARRRRRRRRRATRRTKGRRRRRAARSEAIDAPFDEWSALDAELARIEGKGRSRRGETPTRETHRRAASARAFAIPVAAATARLAQARSEQQEQRRRRQSPPPPPTPKADDDEDPVDARGRWRSARRGSQTMRPLGGTRREQRGSAQVPPRPSNPAPSKAKPDRGGERTPWSAALAVKRGRGRCAVDDVITSRGSRRSARASPCAPTPSAWTASATAR